MKNIKLLRATRDDVFPLVFNPNHLDVTKDFIEDLIGKEIKNIVINNTKEIDIIELPKIRKLEDFSDAISQWMIFLDNPNSEETKKAMIDNEKIKRAQEVLEEISQDPELQRSLEIQEKWELDRKTAIAYARMQGEEKR